MWNGARFRKPELVAELPYGGTLKQFLQQALSEEAKGAMERTERDAIARGATIFGDEIIEKGAK